MAHDTEVEHVSEAMDYKAHEATYRGFLNLTKWAVGIIAVLLVILYFVVRP
jgi:hypothetical protein